MCLSLEDLRDLTQDASAGKTIIDPTSPLSVSAKEAHTLSKIAVQMEGYFVREN